MGLRVIEFYSKPLRFDLPANVTRLHVHIHTVQVLLTLLLASLSDMQLRVTYHSQEQAYTCKYGVGVYTCIRHPILKGVRFSLIKFVKVLCEEKR